MNFFRRPSRDICRSFSQSVSRGFSRFFKRLYPSYSQDFWWSYFWGFPYSVCTETSRRVLSRARRFLMKFLAKFPGVFSGNPSRATQIILAIPCKGLPDWFQDLCNIFSWKLSWGMVRRITQRNQKEVREESRKKDLSYRFVANGC